MGGDLTATSEVGVGSTFTMSLPAEVDAMKAAKKATENGDENQFDFSESASVVLVIDDDPAARDLLRRSLESDGFEVATASSGEMGLDLARSLQPSVITLDVMMPGMDGWTVLQQLKSDPELEHIPVIMVSMAGDRDLGYTLGAIESLTKPVDRRRLLELIKNHARQTGGGQALIVEDDQPTRSLMRKTLEAAHWEVAEAENGAVGLERVTERQPDLILLDLMMPVMDGFDFVLELRKRENGRTIPVIVVTAMDLSEAQRLQLAGGVEHIIEKGAFEQDELLDQVRALVEQHSGSKSA
jgi:DNA-binding response OmpR family regulator